MDFFETIVRRRSIRKFTDKPVPAEVITRALQTAILAPNSSNVQTWDFYWVQTPEKKQALVEACLGQSAARTAQELIVVVANPKSWRRSQSRLIQWVKDAQAPKIVLFYYEKIIPGVYRWGFLNSIGFVKSILYFTLGLFKPVVRSPATLRDIQEVAIKSAALASENFVLAISAQEFSTCMMEGFDECRVKSILELTYPERVVMVIGVGEESERGTWGPRYRIPLEEVVHRI